MLSKTTIVAVLLTAVGPATLVALTVAEPTIAQTLNLTNYEVILLSDIFIFAIICITPVSAQLLRRFGARSVLLVGSLGYLVGSVGAFTAFHLTPHYLLPSMYAFVFLMGIASAPFAPATQSLLVTAAGAEKQGHATAIWTAARTVGFLLAALWAGWIVERYGWNAQFLIGSVGILMAMPLLLGSPDHRPARTDGVSESRLFDVRGLLLLAGWLVPLQLMINVVDEGEPVRLLLLGGGAFTLVCLVGFCRHTLQSDQPIMDISLLKHSGIAAGCAAILLFSFATTGQFEILLLGEVLHYPPDWLSYRATCGGIAQVVGAIVAAYLIHQQRSRAGALFGLLITATGLAAYTQYSQDSTLLSLIWPRAVTGFGVGVLFPVFASAAYQAFREQKTEAIATMIVLATLSGTEFGIEILGALLPENGEAISAQQFQAVFHLQTALVLACLIFVIFIPERIRPS